MRIYRLEGCVLKYFCHPNAGSSSGDRCSGKGEELVFVGSKIGAATSNQACSDVHNLELIHALSTELKKKTRENEKLRREVAELRPLAEEYGLLLERSQSYDVMAAEFIEQLKDRNRFESDALKPFVDLVATTMTSLRAKNQELESTVRATTLLCVLRASLVSCSKLFCYLGSSNA